MLGSDGAVPSPSNTTVTLDTAFVAAADSVIVTPEILDILVEADTVLNVRVSLVAMIAVVAVSIVTVLEDIPDIAAPLAIPVPDTVIPTTRLEASDTLKLVAPLLTCDAGLCVTEMLTYRPSTRPDALPTLRDVAPLLIDPVVDMLVASPLISKTVVPLYTLAELAPSANIKRSSLVLKLYFSNR
jgi:hypothetical protein